MIKRMIALAAFMALPLFPADKAEAATVRIDGGVTSVLVTAPLGDLGLTASAAGTAEVVSKASDRFARFNFGVTGGDTDGMDIVTIEHDGAGLTLSGGGSDVTVGDFVIDVELGALLGGVNGGSDLIPLFDLAETNRDGVVSLLITDTLAGALSSIFGAPDLAGVKFGFGSVELELSEVPLPASALLLLAGVGGLGLMRRRKVAA